MKKAIIIIVGLVVLGAVVVGLKSLNQGQKPVVIGGDKDEGGCLIGAGYSWCEAKQKCLRTWEEYCTAAAPKVADFACESGKTIRATFYPTDDKFVDLALRDSFEATETRVVSVPRALSASGARYANEDESFVFWNKGDTAFIEENGTTTYSGCVTD